MTEIKDHTEEIVGNLSKTNSTESNDSQLSPSKKKKLHVKIVKSGLVQKESKYLKIWKE